MKQKLLFSFLLFALAITVNAKAVEKTTDPIVTVSGNNPVCPGNSAYITITAPANCTLEINEYPIIPYITTIIIGTAGTGTFVMPMLNHSVTLTITKLRYIFYPFEEVDLNIPIVITVIPNGCPSPFSVSSDNSDTICNIGECRTLTATPSSIPSTASYAVSSIPYCPQAPMTDPSYNYVNLNSQEDVWSDVVDLPFNFSFFDQNYTACQIGTNGVISFNPQIPLDNCEFRLNSLSIPDTQFVHKNAIFGVFQDTGTNTTNGESPADVAVSWKIIGDSPCRKLIANFYHMGLYQCNQSEGLQNYQIVLYETSNIIDVYIQNRTLCPDWENGAGVVGIINNTGSLGYTPPGRNTGSWTASNEAWRFTPNGPDVPMTIQWSNGTSVIGSGPSITVCPTVITSYIAEAVYNINGAIYTANAHKTINVMPADNTDAPVDINVCFDPSESYFADLTSNTPIILAANNPNYYEINYFTSFEDAQNYVNPITDPAHFAVTQNQVIYAGIQSLNYDCIIVKSFNITISGPVNAPSGISPQTLYEGQTLADVVVTGSNIQWYDAPEGGNLLPISTVLQNGTTYYATQSVNNCESRSIHSFRLAILVQTVLNNDEFNNDTFNFHPNPTTDILTLTSTLPNVRLIIFNTLPQKISDMVLGNGANIINLSNFASGVYLFQLSSEGKTKTYRVIKN